MIMQYRAKRNESSLYRQRLLSTLGVSLFLLIAVFPPLARSQDSGPTINLWYGSVQRFGAVGNPHPFVNILGKVSDPSGVRTLSYSLNGGPSQPLSIGRDSIRLAAVGDFNADIPVGQLNTMPQTNEVVITAVNENGTQSQAVVTVEYTDRKSWPLPYSVDWSLVTSIPDVVQISDGLWDIEATGVRTKRPGYDRHLMIGELDWQNYEVEVPVTIHRFTGGNPFVALSANWNGHTDAPKPGQQPKAGWSPSGTFSWYNHVTRQLEIYDSENRTIDRKPYLMEVKKTYHLKKRVQTHPELGAIYGFKVWESTEDEPYEWDFVTQGGPSDPQQGSLGFLAVGVDQSFGNIDIVPIGADANNLTGLRSDDFSVAALRNGIWTVYDPFGDSTLTLTDSGTSSARLNLGVPAGVAHDNYTQGLQAPHIMQSVKDSDFEVEVKIDSAVTERFQIQGILVKQDDTNFLRFDVYNNGAGTRIYSATITDLKPKVRVDEGISGAVPIYLRVRRDGDIWTLRYSYNGQNWTTAASYIHQVTIREVGLHSANAGPSPAHTASFDYFFNTSSPANFTDAESITLLAEMRDCRARRQARREQRSSQKFSRSCLRTVSDRENIKYNQAKRFFDAARANSAATLDQLYTDAELRMLDERQACREERAENRSNGIDVRYERSCTEYAADVVEGIGRQDALKLVRRIR